MTGPAYKTTDIVKDILSMSGKPMEDIFRAIDAKYPELSGEQLQQAALAAKDELEERAKEHFSEADMLDHLKSIYDGLPEGTTFEEAVAIKAERGDLVALAIQRQLSSVEHRTHSALLEAALDAHPCVVRVKERAFKWIDPQKPYPGETALIDWFQTKYPQRAREIERHFESSAS